MADIVAGYALSPHGVHGLAHWGRVAENGLRLAFQTGADRTVVALFAVFHDARRVHDGDDGGHGLRGAMLASELRATHLDPLNDEQFDLLYEACAHHTDGRTDADPTVQTCWDADRLDLARVGITPAARYLCTAPAKDPETIRWAIDRSRMNHVPGFARAWTFS